jgi:hypothetical protein
MHEWKKTEKGKGAKTKEKSSNKGGEEGSKG